MGMDSVTSVQVVSATSSMVGFFFLRESLKYLKVLRTWHGLFFLYVTSALPIQIYLARSINMDALVYAEACAVLYYSLRVFFVEECSFHTNQTLRKSVMLLIFLVLGLFTKYSGLLLLCIPLLLAVVSVSPPSSIISRSVFHRLGVACGIGALMIAIEFPYYFERNYKPEGQFFPINMDLEEYGKQEVMAQQERRDADRIAFLREFLWGNSPDASRIQDRDQRNVRLLNTWKDVWSANKHNIQQSGLSLALSTMYANLSLVFLGLGCTYLLVRLSRWTVWDRLGYVFLIFSLVEIAALIFYAYKYPHAIGVTNKGIYIAPALLGFGYLITLIGYCAGNIHIPRSLSGNIIAGFAIVCLAMFLTLNAIIPVY
jgi:hypothetical protein